MKKQLLSFIVALVMLSNVCFAQWTQTPFTVTVGSGAGIFSIGSTVLNGSQYYGVFTSTDNGASWNASNTGLVASQGILCFTMNGTTLFAGTANGVAKSSDNGATWSVTSFSYGVNSLTTSGGNVIAGSYSGGIHISSDNGVTWIASSGGLTGNPYSLCTSGSNVFCGTGTGIFKSADNGATWAVTGMPSLQVNSIAVVGTNIFAATQASGIYKSTDNGTTWTTVNTGLTGWSLYAYSLYTVGTNLFAGTGYAVYLSTNNGATWTDANAGLPILSDQVVSFTSNGTYLFGSTSDHHVVKRLLSEMIPAAGISELQNEIAVSVYPNPAKEKLFIDLSDDTKGAVAEIFNAEGFLVQKITLKDQHSEIQTENLAKGIYFLKVESPAGIAVKKIVKE